MNMNSLPTPDISSSDLDLGSIGCRKNVFLDFAAVCESISGPFLIEKGPKFLFDF